jgi:hypothetical protein
MLPVIVELLDDYLASYNCLAVASFKQFAGTYVEVLSSLTVVIMSISNRQLIPLFILLVGTLVLTPAMSSLTIAAPYSGHFQSSNYPP